MLGQAQRPAQEIDCDWLQGEPRLWNCHAQSTCN